ncbi:MAG: septum site-determining protein MinC [Clostridiales bacterium]|jgi:septum site-determining protein MinC|nr:septum site-determining protein MinC [Clostridiales bacterium]
MNNSVVFKGRKRGIVIVLDKDIPFSELIVDFKQKVLQAKSFFGDSKASITFQGRALSTDEEKQLLDIIFKETGLNISFVDNGYDYKSLDSEGYGYIDPDENSTIYHKGSLRSGQAIVYAGSVVVIGDVNPGGEVIAEGNIIILGSLKGLAHAGCAGNKGCFVSAYQLRPTQLRIANIITYIPKEFAKKNKIRFEPSVAYIKGGQIYIAPLV